MKLKVDPQKLAEAMANGMGTGIYVRAMMPYGKIGNADIITLDKNSLLTWLKKDGGDNPLAENTVGILLGYGHLH